MKDVKVYDGTGWQSLKGPPGPSTPSADAGNALTVGSDGLLMLKGDTTFSGSWSPVVTGSPLSGSAEGSWTRTGRLVTIVVNLPADAGDAGSEWNITGLPFSLGFAPLEAVSVLVRNDPSTPAVGVASTIFFIQAIAAQLGTASPSANLSFQMTYPTDDARLG